MMQTRPTTSESGDLRDLWCSTARRASDSQLAACVAVAIAAGVGFGIGALLDVRRAFHWWPLVLPALLAGTFGLWGIADREMVEQSASPLLSRRALGAVKVCSAVAAGVIAALATIGVLRLTIGTWIS
jgi:hypothetical protein